MKRENLSLVKVLITLIFIALFANNIFAQTYYLSGTQTKKPGANSILKSNTVTITVDYKISKLSGTHDGFWLEKYTDSEAKSFEKYIRFNYVDGVLSPKASTYILKPGTYKVFPNIKTGKNEASVKLKIIPA